nr:AI-2E family transporter [Gandjariella thermophila]
MGALPAALPRGLVVLLGLAALVVVVAGMKGIAWLAGPTFLALVIVIAIAPVRAWLRRHGLPAWLSTLALVVLVYAVIIMLGLVLMVSVARLATVLPQYAGRATALVDSLTAALTRFGVGPGQVREAARSLDLGKLTQAAGSVLSNVTDAAAGLVFLLALLGFLSLEAHGAGARLADIATDRPQVVAALHDFASGTRRYLVVTTVFGLIVAVLDTIALALLGIPLPILWGLLSFITNYIPNIGFVLGVLPPALLGLLIGGWQLMLFVIAIYSALNFVVQSLIQPRFTGHAVGLSTTVAFVSLVFWTWVLGPIGALLSIPLALLAKALLVDIDPRARWADALLRSQPEKET